jgi:tellurite resistance protein TerC
LLDISPLTWGVTIGFIVLLLSVDLVLAAARPHHVGFKEATAWSVFYIAVAIGFGVWFGMQYGSTAGTEYFAGYIIEKSLSVDNLFVFVIIMSTFAVPDKHQHKVLVFGIALGASLISLFSFTFLLFGLLLIYTAVQLFRHRNEDPDIESNLMVRGARRFLPVSDGYIGGRLVAKEDGRRVVTPLFVVLIAIGSVDLLFALDSIPAVFGVTEEAYIVFTANAFALLGLRALFFLVKGLLDRLIYLSAGLAVILAFIGVKLILHWGHVDIDESIPEIPTPLSLGVVLGVLAVVTVASLIRTRGLPDEKAHAGSLTATKVRLEVRPRPGADQEPPR